jgi:peroxiredoxin
MKQLDKETRAPDFELKTLQGHHFRLHEMLKSGPVVLAFYKASCPTCQLMFPVLQRIHAQSTNGAGARIWAVAQDEADEVHEFVDRFGITFDVLIDEHPYEVSAAFQLTHVPAIFVIDSNQVIKVSDYGFSKATLAEIAKPAMVFNANDGLPEARPG